MARSPLRPDVYLDVDLASGRVQEVSGGAQMSSWAPRGLSSSGGAEPWAEEVLAPSEAGRPGLGPAPGEPARARMAASRGGHAESGSGSDVYVQTVAWGSAAARPEPVPNPFSGPSLDATLASVRKRCHAHGGFECWVERVRAPDGALVPLTIARSAAAREPGPAMLLVYGAYGMPLDLSYHPQDASLLVCMAISLLFLHGWGWQPLFRGAA